MQRSSPISPFAFTSARQAFSFGLLATHLALITFSFSIVSFIFDGFASLGAGAGAVLLWAEAMWKLATSSKTVSQALVRNMEIPVISFSD